MDIPQLEVNSSCATRNIRWCTKIVFGYSTPLMPSASRLTWTARSNNVDTNDKLDTGLQFTVDWRLDPPSQAAGVPLLSWKRTGNSHQPSTTTQMVNPARISFSSNMSTGSSWLVLHGALAISLSTTSTVTGVKCCNVEVVRNGTSYNDVESVKACIYGLHFVLKERCKLVIVDDNSEGTWVQSCKLSNLSVQVAKINRFYSFYINLLVKKFYMRL